MASGEFTKVKAGEALSVVKKESIIMDDTFELDNIGDINELSRMEDKFKESSDEKSSTEELEKEKKCGHLRIHSDGQVSYKNINSILIMESTQLGIKETVGQLSNNPERDVLMQDFMTVESKTFTTISTARKSNFVFKTYAPTAFRHFRELFGIKPEHFVSSFCAHSLVELPNPGASGSLFFLTQNDEFIIKTVQRKEASFLQKLLPGYYLNLNQNPLTLLPKFFGLYCFQRDSKNVRLTVMNNVLPSWVKIHQKYDLKGSTYNRKASQEELQNGSPSYKDLDFIEHHPEGIFLDNNLYRNLMKTIQRDCRVLESFQIMDYSLLLGVHNLDQVKRENPGISYEKEKQSKEEIKNYPSGDGISVASVKETNIASSETGSSGNTNDITVLPTQPTESTVKTSQGNFVLTGLPARQSNGDKLLLFVGIIDILQSYRLKKRLEHVWKSIVHDGNSVSVHNPAFYAQRFQQFMTDSVFKPLTSSPKNSKRKSLPKLKQFDKKS